MEPTERKGNLLSALVVRVRLGDREGIGIDVADWDWDFIS